MLQYILYQWGGVRFHWISLPPWYHGIFVSFSWKQLSLNAACSCRFWWNYQRNEPCLPTAELGRKREPNCAGGASGSDLVDHLDPPNTKRFKDVSSKDRRWQEHLFVLCPLQFMMLSEHSVYLLLLLVHPAVHGPRLDFPGHFSDNYHAWSKCSSYCQGMSMSLKISFPFKATKQLWQPNPKNPTRSLAMTPWKRKVNRQLFSWPWHNLVDGAISLARTAGSRG